MNSRRAVPAFVIAILCASTAFGMSHNLRNRGAQLPVKQLVSMPAHQNRAAGLSIGKANTFSVLGCWVTSDLLVCSETCTDPSDYLTDIIWFDDETISLIGSFYTLTDKDINMTVQVKSSSGTVVFEDTFAARPPILEPDTFNFVKFTIPDFLPADAYKVIFKMKQGSKSIGQQFFFNVFQDIPNP